jgi:UPF0176 protein
MINYQLAPVFLVLSAYKFVRLSDLKEKRAYLLAKSKGWNVKGSILLSPEGINLFIAGETDHVEALIAELRRWPGLEDLQPKISGSPYLPFRRMHVRVKKEIIAFGVEGIDPAQKTSPKLPPQELKRWLDEGREVTLLDTRNDYEIKLGTFKNAVSLGIEHFRDFPQAVAKLDPDLKERPVVIFCTGGIRCEKAGPFMEREGFRHVFQLEGGILKYFETCGSAHYQGDCFVFDQRTGLDPELHPTDWAQCFKCRTPLSSEDQAHPHFVPGESCPYCFKSPAEQMAQIIARRHEAVSRIIVPLPGSIARDHYRPISIPSECDGLALIDALTCIVKHIPREEWEERCAGGFLVDSETQPVTASKIVRAGERYAHKFPGLVEPDVNMRVQVLYEDASIVVLNKPAPLPMHAAGRFHRNTLKYVLDELYRPQKLRPAHRLDANTTGVVVAARTQFVAGKIQPQFARGEVEKVYLVRVQGHPAWDELRCEAPISAVAGHIGSRVVDEEQGMDARTDFRVLARSADGSALLEARPRTGRTNQIRVHLWHLGHPVQGDRSYLAGNVLGDTQTLGVDDPPLCLHAWQLTIWHPLMKERMTFVAPPPAWCGPDL